MEPSAGSAWLPGSRLQFLTGFTAMTEKFSTAMYMDRGAEQLVEILNYYISAIVESKCSRGLRWGVLQIVALPVFES